MTSFTLYSLKPTASPRILHDEDIVEDGLSGGEMRQSLLDRLRAEIQNHNIVTVNNCISDFDLYILEHNLQTEEGVKQAITDVEKLLYDASDEQFHDTVWSFTEERICVQDTDEE